MIASCKPYKLLRRSYGANSRINGGSGFVRHIKWAEREITIAIAISPYMPEPNYAAERIQGCINQTQHIMNIGALVAL